MKNDIIKGIIDYIEKHLEEDLSLDRIAEDLNYSKFYIARIFSEKTGGTVYKYIQGRRLTIAAYKLVKTNKSIIEIAYEAHYSSQQAFTLAFNQLYSCSPQAYRKKGLFYPKQLKIDMKSSQFIISYRECLVGGKIAA